MQVDLNEEATVEHNPKFEDGDESDELIEEDEWIAVLDEASGNTYYANLLTNETSWEKPEGFIDKEDVSRGPDLVDEESPSDTEEQRVEKKPLDGDREETESTTAEDDDKELREQDEDGPEEEDAQLSERVDETTTSDGEDAEDEDESHGEQEEPDNTKTPTATTGGEASSEVDETDVPDDQEVEESETREAMRSDKEESNVLGHETLQVESRDLGKASAALEEDSKKPAFMHQQSSLADVHSLDDINDIVLMHNRQKPSLDLVPYPVFSNFPKSGSNAGAGDGSWSYSGSELSLTGIAPGFPMICYVKNHYNFHIVGKFGRTTKVPVEQIISWQTEALTTSIRHLPRELVPVAKQAFRNISGFMGTRSTGKRQNDHCLKLLRNVMAAPEELRDEVYCQLCKQTLQNPSPESALRGWQLMNICLATFPPTTELQPYLAAYCEWSSNLSKDDAAVSKCAMRCVTALEKSKTTPPRCELPGMEEVEAIMENKKIKIPLYLLDGSYKDCYVNSWTTSSDMAQMICKSLGIRQKVPFAIYETSSSEEERIIEPRERILDLYAQWQRMRVEQKSKVSRHGDKVQEYRLVYKVALYVDVDADQVEEINMMYIQAVYDVTSGIYSCSMDDYEQLAAIQMQENVGDFDEKHVAHLRENIHEYLPEDKVSKSVVENVMTKYKALPTRSRQQAKLAYLKLCESWKAYGSSFYVVQNTRNRSLPHDLILAVNHKGVHILDPKSKEFLASYLYINIVSWGYSSNGFLLMTGSAEKEVKNYYKTQQGQIINDMVNAYVNAIVGGISSG